MLFVRFRLSLAALSLTLLSHAQAIENKGVLTLEPPDNRLWLAKDALTLGNGEPRHRRISSSAAPPHAAPEVARQPLGELQTVVLSSDGPSAEDEKQEEMAVKIAMVASKREKRREDARRRQEQVEQGVKEESGPAYPGSGLENHRGALAGHCYSAPQPAATPAAPLYAINAAHNTVETNTTPRAPSHLQHAPTNHYTPYQPSLATFHAVHPHPFCPPSEAYQGHAGGAFNGGDNSAQTYSPYADQQQQQQYEMHTQYNYAPYAPGPSLPSTSLTPQPSRKRPHSPPPSAAHSSLRGPSPSSRRYTQGSPLARNDPFPQHHSSSSASNVSAATGASASGSRSSLWDIMGSPDQRYGSA